MEQSAKKFVSAAKNAPIEHDRHAVGEVDIVNQRRRTSVGPVRFGVLEASFVSVPEASTSDQF